MKKMIMLAVMAIGMIAFTAPEATAHGAGKHHHKKVVKKKVVKHRRGNTRGHAVARAYGNNRVVKYQRQRYRLVRTWVPGYFTINPYGCRVWIRGRYNTVRRYY